MLIGIDIGGTKCAVVQGDENMNITGKIRMDTKGVEETLAAIFEAVEQFGPCDAIGISCGGLHAVYFAAKYPGYVAALYLDAPVLNLLSCPCDLGTVTSNLYASYFKHMGVTVSELLNYRNHPIDVADVIIMEGIPTVLVCGDSDHTVSYEENGKILAERYRKTDVPFKEIVKKNCDHHPHGLDDLSPIIEFVERNC